MGLPKYYPPEKTFELSIPQELKEKKRVLLLEDSDDFANMIKIFLESSDFEVIRVNNGAEGLKALLAKDFDIILCDMVMPTLPGDMFFLAIEKTKSHLCKRFIFMTGHRADPKWDAFARTVHCIMLWKPFPMSDLIAAIDTVLKKSQAEKAP
jgi:DNA-binding response OmpR family regulator